MKKILIIVMLIWSTTTVFAQNVDTQNGVEDNEWQKDAQLLKISINHHYAYLERLKNQEFKLTDKLQQEADKVDSKSSLLTFSERALLLLSDHHAITGSSFNDSWALVPSYSDIWIEKQGEQYIISSIRNGYPADKANINKGDQVIMVANKPINIAVSDFWTDLGVTEFNDQQAGFAARILLAGRRNTKRFFSTQADREITQHILPNLYQFKISKPMIETSVNGDNITIMINDALGNNDLISAFDKTMSQLKPNQDITIDLRNTPSGGNTVIARAIMGWFVSQPTPYQTHILPSEQKTTGIERQWTEYVLPRKGKYHDSKVTVLVGRWTGSMGEGIALGMKHIGADIRGDKMAGLLGAIYDLNLPHSNFLFKIPTERLLAVDGTAREDFIPSPIKDK